MSTPSQVENGSLESLVAQVVDEFMERQRQGERPDPSEYAARYPQAANVLRDVLAALNVVGLSGGGLPAEDDDAALTSGIGTLGDFRIIREVGRGGMGIVYEAEQISLKRRVALKVLPFAAAMDARRLQRFHNEALAAASLDHPHIVKVHAVGQERGVHFFAMQFIDGQTLAELIALLNHERERRQDGEKGRTGEWESKAPSDRCAQSTDLTASPTAPLLPFSPSPVLQSLSSAPNHKYFRRVAEWGIEAAEALDHAHQLGILHRDIKPGNLMIDAQGKLWVTDFGLARTATESGLTMSGDRVGTLRYMSPEQALALRVVIDQRSDVYSLGTTLYELMTLEPVFGGDDDAELLRQIRFDEPKPPRRLQRAIPLELETIVLKALEKNPEDRYATAQEFADDLKRFLSHEPIRARRPGPVARAQKWARRHASAVASAAVVAGLAAVALAIALALIVEANSQKNRLLVEKNKALEAKDEALEEKEDALGQVKHERGAAVAARDRAKTYYRDSLNVLISYYQPQFLHAQWPDQLERGVGSWSQAVAIAHKAADDYPDEAESWRVLMTANDRLSDGLQELGRFGEAMEPQRQATAACRRYAKLAPEPADVLIPHLKSFGDVLRATGQSQEAEQAYEETLKLCREQDSGGWVDQVNILIGIAYTRLEAGRRTEAKEAFNQALVLIREKIAEGPLPDDDKLWDLIHEPDIQVFPWAFRRECRIGLGRVALAEGRAEEAAQMFREALLEDDRYKQACGRGSLRADELGFAWFLISCPIKEIQDPARALKSTNYEINIMSKQYHDSFSIRTPVALAWKIRALASYQVSDWTACNEALDQSKRHRPWDGSALFVRAMVQWQLGNKADAFGVYKNGVKWMQTNRPTDLELHRFRADAAELLGIKDKPIQWQLRI